MCASRWLSKKRERNKRIAFGGVGGESVLLVVIEQKNLFTSIYFYRSNAMDTFSILKVWRQMKKQDQRQH